MDPEILNWLTPVDYQDVQDETLQRQQPGTSQWLIDTAEYKTWLNTPRRTLVCWGLPGAGKTVLASFVVDQLARRRSTDNSRLGLGFIFFRTSDAGDERVEGHFLLTLLKQLAQHQTTTPQALQVLYDTHRATGRRPLTPDILAVLQSSGVGVNFFATSRVREDIRRSLVRRGDSVILSLEMGAGQDDIRRYIEQQVAQIPIISGDEALRLAIVKTVAERAGDSFLYSKLALDSLRARPTTRQIRQTLEDLRRESPKASTEDLKAVYDRVMDQIQGQPQGLKDLAIQCFLWLTCAKRPLAVSELIQAVTIQVGAAQLQYHTLPLAEDLSLACGENCRFTHFTVKQYIADSLMKLFPDSPPQLRIANGCATYLSFTEFNDGPCPTTTEFEARCDAYRLYEYAATQWGHHAREASVSSEPIMNFLQNPGNVNANIQALLQPSPREVSGLHLAAHFGLSHVTDAILAAGIHPNCIDSNGHTPLWWAVREDRVSAVKNSLIQQDVITFHAMVKRGERDQVKLILDAGYDVNTLNFWRRTALHEVVLSITPDTELADVLIRNGVDIDAEDIDGKTALRIAVLRKMRDFVRILLKESANGKDIPLSEWQTAFQPDNRGPLELAAMDGAGLTISFPSPEPNPWKQSDSVSKRSLMPRPIFFHTCHEATSDEHYVYSALARFGSRHDRDIRIRWNVPNNGIELFRRMVIEVEKRLVSLCESNEADLNASYLMLSFHLKRRDILQAKGAKKNLADRLLDQGMAWINLRSAVRDMASDAQKFAREYHKRHQETSSIEGLLGAIKNLSDNISNRISLLDEISKDLIQMVRAPVTQTLTYYLNPLLT
ncbi:hypothetical protein BKA56DRAFT_622975 [Ilyonectria sp. MPI-CAGE-AT-0026]|nr:hypothetical protein BKA56DRAFT_622975 [Ilyonectria sp. MPI-CAGE-AT-0026]